MTVIVLTACTAGLRGQLTRWLMEIAPGVFVGFVSARVRQMLWERVAEQIGVGKGLLVYAVRSEQRLAFETLNHDWVPRDFDGHTLMLRPVEGGAATGARAPQRPPESWSIAARRRRFGRDIERVRRSTE